MSYVSASRRAFSLIELVIVVVIIAIIAAIAVPRMSRGAAGAADAALISNLQVLRNAIDLFQTEHGGAYPSAATITAQLTGYSDDAGNTGAKGSTYYLGPYLSKVPPLPVACPRKGGDLIAAADADKVGWIYTDATDTIRANTTTEADSRGVLYSTY